MPRSCSNPCVTCRNQQLYPHITLGVTQSINWKMQSRGKDARFKEGITCGRKQMSFEYTVKRSGTKSASSKRRIFSSSLLIPQSLCITSQLLHPEPALPAWQQLPTSAYLQVQAFVPLGINTGTLLTRGILTLTSCLTAVSRADPQSSEGAVGPEMKTHPLLLLWPLFSTGPAGTES